ncbi:hypothetical protein NMY22_g15492 [Coprinellus aureogranulatus]|nr:hypothetical protein NMY22_g15492 [Coprinellus aureogranulatus]
MAPRNPKCELQERDYIYSGYTIPIQQFHELMCQILSYKRVRDRSNFTAGLAHLCYSQWRREALSPEGRKKTPRILVYSSGAIKRIKRNDRPTDVLVLIRAIPFKDYAQLDDPNHADALKIKVERDTDRLARNHFVKCYRKQGAEDMNADDFIFAWSRGPHPKLNEVQFPCSV